MTEDTRNILLVEDQVDVASSLIKSLHRRSPDLNIHHISSRREVETAFSLHQPNVAIIDLSLNSAEGPESGLQVIESIHTKDSTCYIVVLTSHRPQDHGLRALSLGASAFVQKPADTDALLSLIQNGIQNSELLREHQSHFQEDDCLFHTLGFQSRSPAMKECIQKIDFAMKSGGPVLLTGETGVGKGVIAKIIHKGSSRSRGKFIRYQPNFGGQDLISSELFGHAKGSFTGAIDSRTGIIEESHCGTLFIDEVDSLPSSTQVLLLETLQEKTFRRVGETKERKSDFRLICALNKDLATLLKEEVIRLDFFHRVSQNIIHLPPLRDRKEDIPQLSVDILESFCSKEKLSISRVSDQAVLKLKDFHWPGNIRQLQSTLENAAYKASYDKRETIDSCDIEIDQIENGSFDIEISGSFREKVKAFEEELVMNALDNANGNQVQAAKSLNMDRSVFRRVLERRRS